MGFCTPESRSYGLRSTARKPEVTQKNINFSCRLPAFLHIIHAVIFTRRQTSSGIPVFRPALQSNLSESPHGGSAQNFRLLSAAPLQNGVFPCNCIPWKIHVLRCRGRSEERRVGKEDIDMLYCSSHANR